MAQMPQAGCHPFYWSPFLETELSKKHDTENSLFISHCSQTRLYTASLLRLCSVLSESKSTTNYIKSVLRMKHFQCVRLHAQLPWLSMYSMSNSLKTSPSLSPTVDTHLMECVIRCRRRHTLTLNRSSQGVCSNWIISRGLPSSVMAVTVSLISLLSW